MPTVIVTATPGVYAKEPFPTFKERMKAHLPNLVALHLSVPYTQAALSAQEVEVRFAQYGPDDIHEHNIAIVIVANESPERIEYCEGAKRLIHEEIKMIWPSDSSYVWIQLVKGYFAG